MRDEGVHCTRGVDGYLSADQEVLEVWCAEAVSSFAHILSFAGHCWGDAQEHCTGLCVVTFATQEVLVRTLCFRSPTR